jgi:hypothetical protein
MPTYAPLVILGLLAAMAPAGAAESADLAGRYVIGWKSR